MHSVAKNIWKSFSHKTNLDTFRRKKEEEGKEGRGRRREREEEEEREEVTSFLPFLGAPESPSFTELYTVSNVPTIPLLYKIIYTYYYYHKIPKSNSSMDRIQLLSTGNGADVHFVVGKGEKKERLPAHKTILSSASDVFEAMFSFDAKKTRTEAESSSDVIYSVEVTDVTIGAFKAMLSFIYADDLSGVNGENAMAVLYAAKKYNLPGLVKACCEFPTSKLSNVFDALAKARLFDEQVLADRCLEHIDKNADKSVQSKQFLRIDQEMLCEILGRDKLEINREISIWNAALRWADAQCRQIGIDCSGENRRAMLGPALHKIRFPLISRKDFTTCIVPSGVLTMEEMLGVYQHHLHPKLSGVPGLFPLQFPTRERVYDRSEATLLLNIERFKKFAKNKARISRCSDAIYVKRLPWKILAQITTKKGKSNQKFLGFFLQNASPKGKSWSCTCWATLRIVSQKEGTVGMALNFKQTFSPVIESWGYAKFITFARLMDPRWGLYNKNEDKVTLAIDVQAVGP